MCTLVTPLRTVRPASHLRALGARRASMRTCVRMGPGPHRPARELEQAVERGDLGMAVAVARDMSREHDRPIPLQLALKLLPLVATQQHDIYDVWACRWLARWLSETPGATIDQAAEIAGSLADLPSEPRESLEAIRSFSGGKR